MVHPGDDTASQTVQDCHAEPLALLKRLNEWRSIPLRTDRTSTAVVVRDLHGSAHS